MATTLDISHVVAAVLSVFHNAADLTKQISKRSKKKKSEQALRQKWLLETLESGELQISQKYSQYLQELGDKFKVGDNVARDRVQHVAIIMQAELLRSLQLALQFDGAELDAGKLQDDAAFFRRDVLSALDELRNRLLEQSPPQPAPIFSQMVPTHQRNSIVSISSPGSPGSETVPSGVNFPEPEEEGGSRRVSRLFSMRTRPHKRSSTSSTIQNMVVAPNLSWLGPIRTEPEKHELPAADVPPQQDPPPFSMDIKVPFPEPDTELLHPAMAKQASIVRQASTSTHSSDRSSYTRNSTFSDEKIPVVDEDDETFFPDAAEVAAALPPILTPAPLNIRPKKDRLSTSSSQFGSTLMSPTDAYASSSPAATSPVSLTPDYSPHAFWFPTHNIPTSNPTTNLPVPSRDRSNTASSGTPSSHHDSLMRPSSIASTPSSSNTIQLGGRPEKKNNYWGFCKGAWTIREDWRKGLAMQVIPAGMFAQDQVWQCKSCNFRGRIYGEKKPYMTDPRVHADPETGIRYRWIFLAKCHIKVRLASQEAPGYGCLFCSLTNVHSSVYGSEGMLFKHIAEEHAPGMTDDVATRANCIMGRMAAAKESFDINIL